MKQEPTPFHHKTSLPIQRFRKSDRQRSLIEKLHFKRLNNSNQKEKLTLTTLMKTPLFPLQIRPKFEEVSKPLLANNRGKKSFEFVGEEDGLKYKLVFKSKDKIASNSAAKLPHYN